jgi:hypothetical protein
MRTKGTAFDPALDQPSQSGAILTVVDDRLARSNGIAGSFRRGGSPWAAQRLGAVAESRRGVGLRCGLLWTLGRIAVCLGSAPAHDLMRRSAVNAGKHEDQHEQSHDQGGSHAEQKPVLFRFATHP